MADERFLIEVRITHSQPLEADAQTIADLAARGITEALSGDPTLLATATGEANATRQVPFWEGYQVGFVDGKVIAIEAAERTLVDKSMRLHTNAAIQRRRDEAERQGAERAAARAGVA
jgi:hypothetical protein